MATFTSKLNDQPQHNRAPAPFGWQVGRSALLVLWLAACAAPPTPAAARPTRRPPQKAVLPTEANGDFHPPELVELQALWPTLRLDIRYATANNFIGRAVYKEARAFLQRPAAEALVRAHQALARRGVGLLIYDGYRPHSVTRLFWDLTPPDKRAFVADPAKGSIHNRGCAVDLTLYDLATQQPVPMPSDYDEMSERASPDYRGGSASEREHRDLLRQALEAEGFTVQPNEWWHFNYRLCPRYRVLDIPFSAVPRR